MDSTKPPRLVFYPFAYALYNDDLIDHCWYCLKLAAQRRRCLGCGCAQFCNAECQQEGWKDHKAECKAFKTKRIIPDIEVRLLGRIVLRHKDISEGKDKKDETFYKLRTSERNIMDIWAHTEEIRKDVYAMKKFEDIYTKLMNFYDAKYLLPKEEVFQVHCRDYINRHAISDKAYVKEIGKGLYLDLCAYDHSCRPNVIYTCDGFVATMRALNNNVDPYNRQTTHYTYIDMLCSLQDRRKQLKDTWYFECQCERCVDPQDHVLTSVLCPKCYADGEEVALEIFGNHSHKNKITGIVTCVKCSTELTQEYVMEGVRAMRFVDSFIADKELEQMPPKTRLEFLSDIFARLSKVLPRINVYLCKIVQNIIPLIDSSDHKELLRLHQLAEPCVRTSFPRNHPAVAFHLRNMGLFLQGTGDLQGAIRYFTEADEILTYVLDENHSMTLENRECLRNCQAELENLPDKIDTTDAKKEKEPTTGKDASATGKDETPAKVEDVAPTLVAEPVEAKIQAENESSKATLSDMNETKAEDSTEDKEVDASNPDNNDVPESKVKVVSSASLKDTITEAVAKQGLASQLNNFLSGEKAIAETDLNDDDLMDLLDHFDKNVSVKPAPKKNEEPVKRCVQEEPQPDSTLLSPGEIVKGEDLYLENEEDMPELL